MDVTLDIIFLEKIPSGKLEYITVSPKELYILDGCANAKNIAHIDLLVYYSTDEVYGSAVCRKKVNSTEGETTNINRAGAVSGYLKGRKGRRIVKTFPYFFVETSI